jgi:hypothetical protein
MSGVLEAVERGLWRGFAAMVTLGAVVWLIDRVFGGGPR